MTDQETAKLERDIEKLIIECRSAVNECISHVERGRPLYRRAIETATALNIKLVIKKQMKGK